MHRIGRYTARHDIRLNSIQYGYNYHMKECQFKLCNFMKSDRIEYQRALVLDAPSAHLRSEADPMFPVLKRRRMD